MKTTALQVYSLGMITHDLPEDDVWAEVHPLEQMSGSNGIIDNIDMEHAKVLNIHGETIVTKIIKSTKIMCKWLHDGDNNRLTPPSVCKGETVRIYRYGNTDKYFWGTIYNELDLRKREKATYVYSNKGTIEDKSLLSKVYYWTIDTINKFVRLHTDDSDGELTTYDFEINTKEGKVTLIDGKNNFIELNSASQNLTTNINNDIITTAGNNMSTMVKKDVNETIGKNKTITLEKISIKNNTGELIAILSAWLQACMEDEGTGNLGSPVPRTSASKNKFQALKKKIDSFLI